MDELFIPDPDITISEYRDILRALTAKFDFIQSVNLEENKIYTIKCTIGDPLEDFLKKSVMPEYKERTLQFIDKNRISRSLSNRKFSETLDFKILSDDGGIEWKRMRAVLLNIENKIIQSYLLTVNDITVEKQNEKSTFETMQTALDSVQKANDAKSSFISRISHEIRTPIHTILGMCELARKSIEDKETALSYINKIIISSRHMLALTNQIMDMRKIESGRIFIKKEEVFIEELVENLISIVQPQADIKNQNLYIDISRIKHKHIIGDSLRMRQCFLNFLSNAVKYTPKDGEIIFAIREEEIDSKHSNYHFIIKDNGYGMSEEFTEHIFEPFAREMTERNTKIYGTGLGMSISSNLIRMMNGEINVVSVPDKGTKFTINMELNFAGEQEEPVCEHKNITGNNFDFKGKRILLAEDNELNMEIAYDILSSTGAEVFKAVNGKNALEMFTESEESFYDVIILDIRMPVMDGCETAKAIRKLDRKDAEIIPVFAMTANIFPEEIESIKESGMQEYISKPFNRMELLNKLSYYIMG